MKITFLGTSHGCAEKNRFTSGTLIETSDFSYLLDAGAPVESLMVNMDKSFENVRGIFITHMHNDHVANLSSVFTRLIKYNFNDNVTCFFPSQEGIDGFLNWLDVMSVSLDKVKETVKFDVTNEGTIFDNGDIRVIAKPTLHMGEKKAFSYTFEKDGKKVLFTGDMRGGFPEYTQIIGDEHYDLVVCEMAHSNLCEKADMLKNTNTDRMIITHYSPKRMIGYEEILKSFPFPTTISSDGMEIDV